MKYCNQCGGTVQSNIPTSDTKLRFVCTACKFIHYQNPKIVVGTVPIHNNEVLLCLRAIEPRQNFWTLPAGFLENGESLAEGAIRETQEEALFTPILGPMLAVVDVVHADQVHIFFRAELRDNTFGPGAESLDVKMFSLDDIPWEAMAFKTGKLALKAYIEKEKNDFEPIYKTIE
jgi:ADP-ribose pyrophosphatase YjhB (NUDIX family)